MPFMLPVTGISHGNTHGLYLTSDVLKPLEFLHGVTLAVARLPHFRRYRDSIAVLQYPVKQPCMLVDHHVRRRAVSAVSGRLGCHGQGDQPLRMRLLNMFVVLPPHHGGRCEGASSSALSKLPQHIRHKHHHHAEALRTGVSAAQRCCHQLIHCLLHELVASYDGSDALQLSACWACATRPQADVFASALL